MNQQDDISTNVERESAENAPGTSSDTNTTLPVSKNTSDSVLRPKRDTGDKKLSRVFDFGGGSGAQRAEQKKPSDSVDVSKKEEFVIPVLRTFQQDTNQVTKTKDGAALRSTLAEEVEERRGAQQEYIRESKQLFKDSMLLKEKHRALSKKKMQKDVSKSDAPTAPIDTQHISQSLSGAFDYMRSLKVGDTSVKGDGADTSQRPPSPQLTEEPLPAVQKSDLGASVVDASPEVTPSSDPSILPDTDETSPYKKQGVLSRLKRSARPETVFTKEERAAMQKKQKETIEEEEIRDAWQKFQTKKEKLKQKGLAARDVRSYGIDTSPRTPLSIKGVFTLLFVFILLAGAVFFAVYIAIYDTGDPALVPAENLSQAPDDIIPAEKRIAVDVYPPDQWVHSVSQGGGVGDLHALVPSKKAGDSSVKISFDEFARHFTMGIPHGLRDAFADYYFVGNYTTDTAVDGVFIISVENYGDALVWMLDWEKNALNAFTAVFPDFLERSNPNNVLIRTSIIDNKDVHSILNASSQKPLSYYFFTTGILVFIVGDAEAVIPAINSRIRAAYIH